MVAIQTNAPTVRLSLSREKKALSFSCVNRKLDDVLFLTKKSNYFVSGMACISKHVKKGVSSGVNTVTSWAGTLCQWFTSTLRLIINRQVSNWGVRWLVDVPRISFWYYF